jgi:hypothetical protein
MGREALTQRLRYVLPKGKAWSLIEIGRIIEMALRAGNLAPTPPMSMAILHIKSYHTKSMPEPACFAVLTVLARKIDPIEMQLRRSGGATRRCKCRAASKSDGIGLSLTPCFGRCMEENVAKALMWDKKYS